ncbi:hypothetical protein pb186bvf_020194 [Paramecium bursaria]
MQQENQDQIRINTKRNQQSEDRKQRRKTLKEEIQKIKQMLKDPNPRRGVLKNSHSENCQQIKTLRREFFEIKKRIKDQGQYLDDQYNQSKEWIKQQIKQLDSKYQQEQQQLTSQYYQNRIHQVTQDYTDLVSAEFSELLKIIYKEDFNEIEAVRQNLMDHDRFEQVLSNFRKRIIKQQIFYHLFVSDFQVIVQKNSEEQKVLYDQKNKLLNNLNDLSNAQRDNNRQYLKNEKVVNELTEQQQELEQQCKQIRDYINLRKAQQQNQHLRSQLKIYEQEEQRITQEILNIQQNFVGLFEQTQKNIEDDNSDIIIQYSSIQSCLNEIQQQFQEKLKTKKKQDEVIRLVGDDQSEAKLILLAQVIEKHTQVRNFSEQQHEECIQDKIKLIQQKETQKKINQNSIEICHKNMSDCKVRGNEIQINITELDKKIKCLDNKIQQDNQKVALINTKFNEFRVNIVKTLQQPQDGNQYILLTEQILNQIEDLNKHILNDGGIQKKFQDLVRYYQIKGQNRPHNHIIEQYMKDYKENLNQRQQQLELLQDQQEKIEQQLSEQRHQLQITHQNNEAKKIKKRIIKLKQKCSLDQHELLGIQIQMAKYKQQMEEFKIQLISI